MVTPMEKPKVEHHFDFGSPNCYFAHRVIGAIEQRTGATFIYVPILLGGVFKATNNQAPLIAFKDIANKLAYDRLEINRFIMRRGLNRFRMNPHFPVKLKLQQIALRRLDRNPLAGHAMNRARESSQGHLRLLRRQQSGHQTHANHSQKHVTRKTKRGGLALPTGD